jgi:hypothetical protein
MWTQLTVHDIYQSLAYFGKRVRGILLGSLRIMLSILTTALLMGISLWVLYSLS